MTKGVQKIGDVLNQVSDRCEIRHPFKINWVNISYFCTQ